MKLCNKNAEIFIPDGCNKDEALERTTHMTIAAHQDDIEIMAYEGISECFGRNDKWHLGVVVTNGAGSPRSGIYADFLDDDMQTIRRQEQKKAAYIGEYGAQVMLDYPSRCVKDRNDVNIINDIKSLIIKSKPQTIYTHNLADKHDTHVGVVIKVIKALRELGEGYFPKKAYGCEVWRNLDWLCDEDKIIMDVAERDNIAASLLGVFDSQVCGGKRYDKAAIARRITNATFLNSHETDSSSAINYAIDLMPLILNKNIEIDEYIRSHIQRFMDKVIDRITEMT